MVIIHIKVEMHQSTKLSMLAYFFKTKLLRFLPAFCYNLVKGGQRYFFGGCAFARMLPLFLRPLALDRNDFKFASALSAFPL